MKQHGDYYRDLTEEENIGHNEEEFKLIDSLNTGQMADFREIFDHMVSNREKVFFVDGPGGRGMMFLYRTLLAKVQSMGRIVVATMTGGLLPPLCWVVELLTPGSRSPYNLETTPFATIQSKVAQQLCCVKHL